MSDVSVVPSRRASVGEPDADGTVDGRVRGLRARAVPELEAGAAKQ